MREKLKVMIWKINRQRLNNIIHLDTSILCFLIYFVTQIKKKIPFIIGDKIHPAIKI